MKLKLKIILYALLNIEMVDDDDVLWKKTKIEREGKGYKGKKCLTRGVWSLVNEKEKLGYVMNG